MKSPFDGNYISLIREMEQARRQLDKIPDDYEFTTDNIGVIENLAYEARYLADVAKATLEMFQKGDMEW